MNDAGLKCFLENRNLFSNAQNSPEKFNLYNGLAGLSSVVADLIHKIDSLTAEIEDLKHKLRQHNLI
jgi:hypothetical protein